MSGGRGRVVFLRYFIPLSAFCLAAVIAAPSASPMLRVVESNRSNQIEVYGNLQIGYMQSIDSLNPYVALNDVSRVFRGLVYDCLQSVGENLNVTPNLARTWFAVPTGDPEMVGMPYGSIWQYNLTRDANWSDGTPFTAEDVVYNIWLNSDTSTFEMWASQPYAYFVHQAWMVDDYTVRISFWDPETGEPQPCSYAFLMSIPILPKHLLEGLGRAYLEMDWTGVWPETTSPGMPIVGTGPFVATSNIYSEWLQGDHITLVRNPYYHQQATDGRIVKFSQLTMRFFQDSTSMVLALKNGTIDVAAFPPTAYLAIKNEVEAGQLSSVEVFDVPKVTQYWTEIAFNMNDAGPNPSRLDPIVRQALHMATNKQHIVDNYYFGLGEVGTTLIPPVNAQWHYEPNASEKAKFAYDLEAAAALLEANGYIDIDSDGIRECTIDSPAVQLGYVDEGKDMVYEMLVREEHPEEKDIAMYLKDQWSQIGVFVNYLVLEEITMASVAYAYAYDTLIWDWSGGMDPNYQLFVLSSFAINGWSDCMYRSAEYDNAYRYSVNTTDPVQRKTWVDEAQRIFYNDSAYIILSYVQQGYAWRTDTFTGWGDWSANPGRSIDNHWSANPLFFDLILNDQGPIPLYITAQPNPSRTGQSVDFNISAMSTTGRALTFTLEFGDGKDGHAHSYENTTDVQYVHITHRYTKPGNYTLTITVDDDSDSIHHAVTTELVEWMHVEQGVNTLLIAAVGGAALATAGVAIAVGTYLSDKKRRRGRDGASNQMPPGPLSPPK